MNNHYEGLVIRTAFNNQGWADRCRNPLTDDRCFKCRDGKLFINHGKPVEEDSQGRCEGNPENYPLNHPLDREQLHWCWEQVLCKRYFWGNVRGRWRSTFPGMPVYFVFSKSDGSLTLWGSSTVERIDNTPDKYPPVFFNPFVPFPEDKWIRGLSGKEITGSEWRQGNFRYLDAKHEGYLASLIKGGSRENIAPTRHDNINIELRRDIRDKLEGIAEIEGRQIEDLIREALAKLIRERG
ncbi:MAG: hypothetical protein ACYDHW_08140 [Syntrophorhabdaceae bacterium]